MKDGAALFRRGHDRYGPRVAELRLVDRIIERGIGAPTYAEALTPPFVVEEGKVFRSIWADHGDWRHLPDRQIIEVAQQALLLPQGEPLNDAIAAALAREARRELSRMDKMPNEALGRHLCSLLAPEPEPDWLMSPDEVLGCPVVVADNVARYLQTLPPESLKSVISRVVPVHQQMFIEMKTSHPLTEPAIPGERSGGVLVELIDKAKADQLFPEQPRWSQTPRFYVRVRVVQQYGNDRPVGPIHDGLLGLDHDGRILRDARGHDQGLRGLQSLGPGTVSTKVENNIASLSRTFLVPALVTISLMHCKNVPVREVSSAPLKRPTRGRSARGRTAPLETYSVVDIGAITKVLEREGEIRGKGLANALRYVRAHYKTYTPARPLMGKHSGEYFWAEAVRGTAEEGVRIKDYEAGSAAVQRLEAAPDGGLGL